MYNMLLCTYVPKASMASKRNLYWDKFSYLVELHRNGVLDIYDQYGTSVSVTPTDFVADDEELRDEIEGRDLDEQSVEETLLGRLFGNKPPVSIVTLTRGNYAYVVALQTDGSLNIFNDDDETVYIVDVNEFSGETEESYEEEEDEEDEQSEESE